MSEIITSPERNPFEWIEIDQSLCANVYGSSPCTAAIGTTGSGRCFNTRATCQDPNNYDGSDVLTLYFCRNRGYIPDDHQYEPYLEKATISAATINPGGGNGSVQALGMRSTLSVSLSDHPHTDVIVDPYVTSRDYDPFERSTFWAKWRARNPYYTNRPIRHNSSYIDPDTGLPDPATIITRTYFMTGFSGPTSSNGVQIQAKDLLSLAANEKAKAPIPNTGKLYAAINSSVGTLTLTPTGVGDLEYGYSGHIRIGSEVMTYTRATGSDDLTIVRGQEGTAGVEHQANDTVQQCLVITSQTPADILEMLLVDYVDIDPVYLDLAQWATETADFLPRLYTAIITEPTGVTQLINEMCEQMYFTVFWDDRNALLKLRAVRPVEGETVTLLTDSDNLLEDSITWTDKPEELITQVWIRYAQIDPTKQLDELANYAVLDIVSDPSAESLDRNATSKIKEINARWLTQLDGAAAIELGDAILKRYNHIPRHCAFSVDAKDRDVWLADFVTIDNRNNVDFYGEQQPMPMQIISAIESVQGTRYEYIAAEYSGGVIQNDLDEWTVDISADTINVNLLDAFKSVYAFTPVSGDVIKFTIRKGVRIGGIASTYFTDTNILYADIISSYTRAELQFLTALVAHTQVALETGNTGTWPTGWPTGVILKLVIEPTADVLGQGGTGGADSVSIAGKDGGDAIEVGHPITIYNYGVIGGGGGGGCGMRYYRDDSPFRTIRTMRGGGGAGFNVGYAYTDGSGNVRIASDSGFDGMGDAANGYGAIHNPAEQSSLLSTGAFLYDPIYYAGDGGGLGEDGNPSGYKEFTIENDTYSNFGAAGAAISTGSNLITWANKGSIYGAEN